MLANLANLTIFMQVTSPEMGHEIASFTYANTLFYFFKFSILKISQILKLLLWHLELLSEKKFTCPSKY